jgi:hypothetical protein
VSDKPLILTLPEELIERAQAANLDLRQLLIETLEDRLSQVESDLVQIITSRLPPDRAESALQALQHGQRVLGLHAGTIWISADFDDPLPDEFWLGDDA